MSNSLERSIQKLSVFMKMCNELSTLSYDDKYKVASIIITKDYREVCAIGYNGGYKGGPNKRSSLEQGKSGFLHAEENALFHLCKPYELRGDLLMLCTHKPCSMCARRIVNSGIKNIIYYSDYIDAEAASDDIFKVTGTSCVKFDQLLQNPAIILNILES
jgi:dCMP deaminase